MFYAEHSMYGTSTLSDGDTLYRFETRVERDAWVSEMNSESDEDHWAAVRRKDVEHRYDLDEFESGGLACPAPDVTCLGSTPLYIHMRRDYVL